MSKLVAVYGSLKKGEGNHSLLSDSPMVGEGLTEPKFKMLHLGGFPGIVPGNKKVIVEVYKVDDPTFARLDRLEGYPSFYNRTLEMIKLLDGTMVEAWIYQLTSPMAYSDDKEVHQGEVANWSLR